MIQKGAGNPSRYSRRRMSFNTLLVTGVAEQYTSTSLCQLSAFPEPILSSDSTLLVLSKNIIGVLCDVREA
uniref:Uncharacterized protein n=1 Tax=Steinernema glaseri TaxID=37863 RepID=A0A1I7Z5U7_9BILA